MCSTCITRSWTLLCRSVAGCGIKSVCLPVVGWAGNASQLSAAPLFSNFKLQVPNARGSA